MTKKERNVLGKLATTLIILTGILTSAVSTLRIYAPTQERLITVLNYIVAVLEAIINQSPMPETPSILLVQGKNGVFSIQGEGENEGLEINPGYQEITRTFGNTVDVSLFPDALIEQPETDFVRTK